MSKKKEDPSKASLRSPKVEGQGTTNQELTSGVEMDSSRKKNKK